MILMRRASRHKFGSVVIMPSTSVQISILSRAQPCADNRGRKIRAAAPNGGRDSRLGRADKTAHHRNSTAVEQWLNPFAELLIGFVT